MTPVFLPDVWGAQMSAVPVLIPSPGESVAEARISKWHKGHGEQVKVDDPLFDLESDKAQITVNAQVGGVLSIQLAEGTITTIGAQAGSIDTAATASSHPSPATPAPAVAPTAAPTQAPASAATPAIVSKVAPSAGRILAEHGIAPQSVTATGPKQVLTKEDAVAAVAALAKPVPMPTAPLAPAAPQTIATPRATGRETRESMSMIRRRIAERLLQSQNSTATLTTFNEADMTAIQELRTKYNERFEKKHGIKLGFMSIFVKAAVEALKAFPVVNARIDGTDIVYQNFYDVSVAVSTEKGLTVPVIRDADQLSCAQIEKTILELAKKARDGKLSPQDMTGGTFTITNGGIFGSMMSTPILNPPQCAILGMHSIQKRAVVVNDQIVIRPMMYLALSYDHRLIDGREAVQFLVRIKECVENPERIFFEI